MAVQVLNAGFDRLWENNNKGVSSPADESLITSHMYPAMTTRDLLLSGALSSSMRSPVGQPSFMELNHALWCSCAMGMYSWLAICCFALYSALRHTFKARRGCHYIQGFFSVWQKDTDSALC